ncbi:MAG: hypothetical protein ACKPKO_46745, partial [Candidatus Fonsibacter sp.]
EAYVAETQYPKAAILMAVSLSMKRHLVSLHIHPNAADLGCHIGMVLAVRDEIAQPREPPFCAGATARSSLQKRAAVHVGKLRKSVCGHVRRSSRFQGA